MAAFRSKKKMQGNELLPADAKKKVALPTHLLPVRPMCQICPQVQFTCARFVGIHHRNTETYTFYAGDLTLSLGRLQKYWFLVVTHGVWSLEDLG